MSLPTPVLQSLQQAGQGVHNATVQIAEAVKNHGLKVVTSIANDPFSPEGEKAFSQLRTMSRLGRELNGLEEKLRELYQLAEQLSSSEPAPVLVALAPAAKEMISAPASNVQDVVAKAPAKTPVRVKAKAPVKALVKTPAKTAVKAAAKTAKTPAKTAAVAAQPVAAAPAPAKASRPLSANDAKILASLKKSLNRKSWTNMTHSAISQLSNVPSGSIGISLKRLIQAGKLLVNPAGAYQLGAD